MLPLPEIGVRDEETRLWVRDRHRASLFSVVEQSIEVCVTRVHVRFGDLPHLAIGELSSRKASTRFFESQKLFVVIRGDEVAGDPTVTRDRHRTPLSAKLDATDVSRELGCWNRFDGLGPLPRATRRNGGTRRTSSRLGPQRWLRGGSLALIVPVGLPDERNPVERTGVSQQSRGSLICHWRNGCRS
jgi:hypothetical protein